MPHPYWGGRPCRGSFPLRQRVLCPLGVLSFTDITDGIGAANPGPNDPQPPAPPVDLQWKGVHAPTQLGELLQQLNAVFWPTSDNRFRIDMIGTGDLPKMPAGQAIPEVDLPFVDRRGKIVFFTSAPNPIMTRTTIIGPTEGMLDWCARDVVLMRKGFEAQMTWDADKGGWCISEFAAERIEQLYPGQFNWQNGVIGRIDPSKPFWKGEEGTFTTKAVWKTLRSMRHWKRPVIEHFRERFRNIKPVQIPNDFPSALAGKKPATTWDIMLAEFKKQLGRELTPVVIPDELIYKWIRGVEQKFAYVAREVDLGDLFRREVYRCLYITDDARFEKPALRRLPKYWVNFGSVFDDGVTPNQPVPATWSSLDLWANVARPQADGSWRNNWVKVPVVQMFDQQVIVTIWPLFAVKRDGTRDPIGDARELEPGEITLTMWMAKAAAASGSPGDADMPYRDQYFKIGFRRDVNGAIVRLTDAEAEVAWNSRRDVIIVADRFLMAYEENGQIINDADLEKQARAKAAPYLGTQLKPRIQEAIGFVDSAGNGQVSEISYSQDPPITTFKRNAWFLPGGRGLAALGSGAWMMRSIYE